MEDINAIWGALEKLGAYVHLEDEIRRKTEQVNSVSSRRCGNCDHWMKSSCIPEKENKQFKSMNSYACKDFALCHSSEKLQEKFATELASLENRMKGLFTKQIPITNT